MSHDVPTPHPIRGDSRLRLPYDKSGIVNRASVTLTAVALCTGLLLVGEAKAETLRQALEKAYRTNPSLTAARAGQRATDEGVPIAKAAARPALSATADYQEFVVRSANSFVSPFRAANAGVNLSMPVFQGGAVRNSIRAADARVDAGREGLRATESDVFTAVVAAYVDVLRSAAWTAGVAQRSSHILRLAGSLTDFFWSAIRPTWM